MTTRLHPLCLPLLGMTCTAQVTVAQPAQGLLRVTTNVLPATAPRVASVTLRSAVGVPVWRMCVGDSGWRSVIPESVFTVSGPSVNQGVPLHQQFKRTQQAVRPGSIAISRTISSRTQFKDRDAMWRQVERQGGVGEMQFCLVGAVVNAACSCSIRSLDLQRSLLGGP